MKLLWAFLVLIIASGIAQATYVNDQAFGLGNGAYITVNTTTIDDSNQLACCDNNQLMMRINGSMTNYTAGVNKTITSVTFNNVTDNFTIPVSGVAGYLNFSAIMANASNSYNLTANGAFVESRNTTADGKVWFNYTGDATLSVTWNSSTGGAEPPAANGSPAITSNLNNHTNTAAISFTADINEVILFSVGANQSVTWTWTGATEGAGDGTANSTATKQFTTSGVQYVNVSGTNANGSTSLLSWTVTVSTEGGGGGTNWDYAYGWVNWTNGTMINGASISTSKGTVSTNAAGYYVFGYVFEHGLSYNFNISANGIWDNKTVSFASGDYQIVNGTLQAPITNGTPNITSWGNDNTSNATLTLTVPKNTNITFNATSNQTLTGCTWIGATQINCTASTYAYKNFTSTGVQTVSITGSNVNGSTQTITWTITVTGIGGLNITGYVYNILALPVQNAKINLNSSVSMFTNASGYYNFSNVTEGSYSIISRAIGYYNSTNTSTINNDQVINFTMRERMSAQVIPGFRAEVLLIAIATIYLFRKHKSKQSQQQLK